LARPRKAANRYGKYKAKSQGSGARKAVLYARVSTRDQEREGYSIPAQVKLLEDYAALHGLTIASSHIDVETARKAGRTAFGEMLRYLRRNPGIRILLVEKTDRLYRNIKDWAIVDDLGIEVHFVKENFVLSDDCRSSEKFMHGIKVLMAKSYIDNLSEESTKGMVEKARQGLWPSYAPIGYANVLDQAGRKAVIVDPEVGPRVSLLFEWFATGRFTLNSLTIKARQAGLRGRRGKGPVCKGTVHRVLRNRFYTGSFDWRGETYAGFHEPLVSMELWEAVQEIMDGRASSNVRAEPHIFPFTGLIQCGHCGCAVIAEIKKGRYIYYHCSGYRGKCPERYLRQEALEERLVGVLRQLGCSDDEFDAVRQCIRVNASGGEPDDQPGSFRRKGELAGAPGALTQDGIKLLDMGRSAWRNLPALPAEAKREMLGLLLSQCTWANQQLGVTFQRPFELMIQQLMEIRRPDAADRSAPGADALQILFDDPPSKTRRLIARYNAMLGLDMEVGQSDCLWEDVLEVA